jgi:hypothetical protein
MRATKYSSVSASGGNPEQLAQHAWSTLGFSKAPKAASRLLTARTHPSPTSDREPTETRTTGNFPNRLLQDQRQRERRNGPAHIREAAKDDIEHGAARGRRDATDQQCDYEDDHERHRKQRRRAAKRRNHVRQQRPRQTMRQTAARRQPPQPPPITAEQRRPPQRPILRRKQKETPRTGKKQHHDPEHEAPDKKADHNHNLAREAADNTISKLRSVTSALHRCQFQTTTPGDEQESRLGQ